MTDKKTAGKSLPRTESGKATKRPERIPVSGQRDILTVRGKDNDYVYRWIKDEQEQGQRILKFKNAGYVFVDEKDGLEVGQNHVYKSKNVGSLIRVPAGQGEFLYLMKQRKEFYTEDQAAKQDQILDTERQLSKNIGKNADVESGSYGSVSIK